MTPRQTALWIMAIVMVFFGAAVFKADPDWSKFYRDVSTILSTEVKKAPVEPLADDADFQTIHYVKVVKANVRAKATTKSKVVTVLDQNQTVDVLKHGERWSQIQVDGKIGWISNKLLSTRVE